MSPHLCVYAHTEEYLPQALSYYFSGQYVLPTYVSKLHGHSALSSTAVAALKRIHGYWLWGSAIGKCGIKYGECKFFLLRHTEYLCTYTLLNNTIHERIYLTVVVFGFLVVVAFICIICLCRCCCFYFIANTANTAFGFLAIYLVATYCFSSALLSSFVVCRLSLSIATVAIAVVVVAIAVLHRCILSSGIFCIYNKLKCGWCCCYCFRAYCCCCCCYCYCCWTIYCYLLSVREI